MSELNIKSAIYTIMNAIPYGRVWSYGKVAELAGVPGSSRYVGRLLRDLPAGSQLPWHRVISSSGKLAFPENSDSFHRQKHLLEKEGIIFKDNSGKLDINRYSI